MQLKWLLFFLHTYKRSKHYVAVVGRPNVVPEQVQQEPMWLCSGWRGTTQPWSSRVEEVGLAHPNLALHEGAKGAWCSPNSAPSGREHGLAWTSHAGERGCGLAPIWQCRGRVLTQLWPTVQSLGLVGCVNHCSPTARFPNPLGASWDSMTCIWLVGQRLSTPVIKHSYKLNPLQLVPIDNNP